ncbi:hypothetical protein RhiTH_010795 [Rhizoctonia solani]
MPEIFVNLYYFGAGLDRTLFGVWGRSKEARIHTGLVIMDRAEQKLTLNVRQVQCCGMELQVGIFPGLRKQLVYHEVTFMLEVWDTNKGLFGFHPLRNVCMKLLPPNEGKKPHPVDIGQMWTKAGSKALADESSMNVAE